VAQQAERRRESLERHDTQRHAEAAAKKMLQNQGGGELTIKGEHGKIQSKDTIPPGNDPNPPKDTEH
jgi:hypothetical protein